MIIESRLPIIPGLSNFNSTVLQMSADGVALRFCAPVYLVGSCMKSPKPNDIDIIIVVTQVQFLNLFGLFEQEYNDSLRYNTKTESRARMARITKKYRDAFAGCTLDIDLKFNTQERFKTYEGLERIRLDQFEGVFDVE